MTTKFSKGGRSQKLREKINDAEAYERDGIEEGGSHNFVKIGDITYGRPLKLLGREEVED